MNVLVISDSHDRKNALKTALTKGKEEGCEAIIFCGDSSFPDTFQLLIDDGRPLYAVLGNVEHDIDLLKQRASSFPHVAFDPMVLTFSLDEKTIALTHEPGAAETLAREGKYDAVFHGHTHQPRIEYLGRILLGNPGEISGHMTGKRSFGIYNTKTSSFQIVPFTASV